MNKDVAIHIVIYFAFAFIFLTPCCAVAKNVVKVIICMDSLTNEKTPFASLKIWNNEGEISYISTNEEGSLDAPTFLIDSIEASAFGYKSKIMALKDCHTSFNDTLQIKLSPLSTNLSEIVVMKKKLTTSAIDGGYAYDMSANKRAQQENMLQALQYVCIC